MDNSNKITVFGEIVVKEELKVFDSGFQIQKVVVKTYGDYPDYFPIDFKKDNVDKLKFVNVGDHVEVSAFAGGRMWTNNDGKDMYFAGYTGTFMKKAESEVGAIQKVEMPEPGNDLPF